MTPEKVAVTPASTLNTRLIPPPLTVTPAAGATKASIPVVFANSSCPSVRVIVCGVANTVESKVIVLPEIELAARIASRRLVVPPV